MYMCVRAQSCPTLFNATDYVALQAPLSMGFPGKNTGMGCHAILLQGIFLTQGSNPYLRIFLNWQADSLPLSHLGSPILQEKLLKKKSVSGQWLDS